jgi:hypothetical protein
VLFGWAHLLGVLNGVTTNGVTVGNEVTSEKYFNRGTPALPQQSMIAYGAPRLLAAKSLGRIPGRILPTGPALQEELRRQNGLSPWAWIKENHMTSSGRDSMLTQWPSEEWKTIAALLYLFRMGKVHAESYLAIFFLGNYLTTRAGTEARVREHD